jgi:hypothetical protein
MPLHIARLPILAVSALSVMGLVSCGGWNPNNNDVPPAGPAVVSTLVATADVTHAGHLDAVSIDANPGYPGGSMGTPCFVSVRLQGTPAGTFQDPLDTDTSPSISAMAVADLFGTGFPDLVLAASPGQGSTQADNYVTVCTQSTTMPGTFPDQVQLALGARDPMGVAVADLYDDGQPGILVAATGGTDLLFFRQEVKGTFTVPPVSIPVGAAPVAVATANLMGSGTDLLAATATGVTVLLHGATAGTFQAPVAYAAGQSITAMAVADLDGDGHPDVVLVNGRSAMMGVCVLLQQGATGTFKAPVLYSTGDACSSSVAVGVLGSDTLPSLVVANSGYPGYSGSVAVLRPDATHPGQFQAPVMYMGYYGPCSIALGDLNGDGLLDMLVSDGYSLVRFQDPSNPGFFLPPIALRY